MDQRTDEVRAILDQLKTPLPPVKRPAGYTLGLVGTALFVVIMPVVYLGLVGLVAWACWWHLTTNFVVFSWGARGINALLLEVFVYGGPALAGLTMLVFMVKPLFVGSENRPTSRVLGSDEAPDFVELVHALADAVGAPRPVEIRIDSQVNASASFQDGLAGVIRGRLVLTVGMPLLAGMNTREVLGILAHEFGHFSQGGGMRLSFVVRSLTYWFGRIISHRDSWDEGLDKAAKESDIRIGVFFHLARFFVWVSRRALWVVATLSHLVCLYLLRAMEFDADRYEAQVSGSDQFAKTAHHLRRLGAAWQQANAEAARAWEDGALPRDFVGYVGYLEQRLDPEVDGQLSRSVQEEKASWWSTHPLDRDREARAQAAAALGILTVEVPCSRLFPRWEALAEACSDVYYASRLGEDLDPGVYKPTDEIIRSSEELRRDREAFAALVGPWAGVVAPLDYHRHEGDADLPDDDAEALQAIEDGLPAIEGANQEYDEANSRRKVRFGQKSALAAGYRLAADDEVVGTADEAQARLDAAAEGLQRALAPVQRRLVRGLRSEAPNPVREGHERVHRALVAHQDAVDRLNRDVGALSYLISQSDNQKPERWNEIQRLVRLVHDHLGQVYTALADLPYLFGERDQGRLTEHVFGGVVVALDKPNEVYQQASRVLDRLNKVYQRTLGRLARSASVSVSVSVSEAVST